MTVLHAACLTAVSVYFRNMIFVQIIDRKDFRSRILILLHNIYSTIMFLYNKTNQMNQFPKFTPT